MSVIPVVGSAQTENMVGAYTSGMCVGGVITLPLGVPITYLFLNKLIVGANGNIAAAPQLQAYVFSAEPTNSTLVDGQPVEISMDDFANLIDYSAVSVTLAKGPTEISADSIWLGKLLPSIETSGQPTPYVGAGGNIYVVLVAANSFTTLTEEDFSVTAASSIYT